MKVYHDIYLQWKLFRAIQRGNVAEVERLIQSKCVNVRGRHELGWTALHLAAVKGRPEVSQSFEKMKRGRGEQLLISHHLSIFRL